MNTTDFQEWFVALFATVDPTSMRLYNIVAINDKTGAQVFLTDYPMTHKECTTMLSKMTDHKDTRKILIEVKQGGMI